MLTRDEISELLDEAEELIEDAAEALENGDVQSARELLEGWLEDDDEDDDADVEEEV